MNTQHHITTSTTDSTYSYSAGNVTPKIELSSQRTERVDVRVLPVIFSFEPSKDVPVFPGQLVDVYINEQYESGK